jgi:DNA-binding transcriptional LysR family regulator
MELRQLRHFVAVVDAGNLSRAASRVAISQPALTRSIKNLERLLGVELLERKPRGVAATEAGLAFYHQAQVVLNACGRLTRDVRELKRGVTGTVHIGIAPMFGGFILDEVVTALAAEQPALRLVVTEAFFEELVRELLDGRIDVMFCNFPLVAMASDLATEGLLDVRSPLVASVRHPLAKRRDVQKSALVDQRWVVVDQPHSLDALEKFFAADGLPGPRDVFRTNSLVLMRSLLISGAFIGAMPEHLIASELQDGTLRRVPVPGGTLQRRAGLVHRGAADTRPSISIVLQALRRACAARGAPPRGRQTGAVAGS